MDNNWYDNYYGVLFKTLNGVLTYIRIPKESINTNEDILKVLEPTYGPVQLIKIS